MSREITVITPENIPLTLELAGLGSRFGAVLVDMVAQAVVTLVLLIGGSIALVATAFSSEEIIGGWLIAAGTLLLFLIWFGYFILFETIWNGQTPGKRLFALRVVRDGGYPITVFAALARNLVRVADFLPIGYGVGAVVVFAHPEYKRLGDLAAGTLVVKERPAVPPPVRDSGAHREETAPVLPPGMQHPADVLSAEEIALLRRFAIRRWQMTSDDSERLAYRLIVPLVPRLNLSFSPDVPPRYADLVSFLVAAADARETDEAPG